MPSASNTGARPYRRNRDTLLATNDTCWLCGHDGAQTADHITPAARWPRGPDGRHLPGLDDITNLAPAHGTMGNKAINPCPTCGRLCNQARGDKAPATQSPRSRVW